MNNKGVGNSKNQRTERFLFAGKQNLHFLQKRILLLSKTNLIKQILNDSISLFKYLLMLHKKKCASACGNLQVLDCEKCTQFTSMAELADQNREKTSVLQENFSQKDLFVAEIFQFRNFLGIWKSATKFKLQSCNINHGKILENASFMITLFFIGNRIFFVVPETQMMQFHSRNLILRHFLQKLQSHQPIFKDLCQ